MPTRYLIKRYRSSQGAADHQIGQPVGGPRRIDGMLAALIAAAC